MIQFICPDGDMHTIGDVKNIGIRERKFWQLKYRIELDHFVEDCEWTITWKRRSFKDALSVRDLLIYSFFKHKK